MDVVPGSVVNTGSPILTLQMMDPIVVEIEVSADISREIQRRRQVPITFMTPDGKKQTEKAFVYLVDPSADASTRTFTVTLLIINEEFRPSLPDNLKSEKIARTQDVWPLNINEIIGEEPGLFFVEQDAIETEGESSHIWLIKGVKLGGTLPDKVKVVKEKVNPGTMKIPFLGNWVFQQITFENKSISTESIIAGKLEFPDYPRSEWDGETIMVDSGKQWLLRPGDLVNVNIDPEKARAGFFVPVEAIYEDLGKTYIFIEDNGTARKTEIKAILPKKLETGSSIRIEPIGDPSGKFPNETRIVVGGVHYLNDGDAINVVEELDGPGEQK